MADILFIFGIFLWVYVFFVFILDFFDRHKIKPLYRKQRIIELTTAGGKKIFVIQQQHKILKNWYNTYEYSSFKTLNFNTFNEAKNKLEKLIKEKQEYNLKQNNNKIVDKKVVAITE